MEDEFDTWGPHLLNGVTDGEATSYHLNYFYFLKSLIDRLNSDQHAVILVTGDQGKGKSTFALNSAAILKQGGVKFGWDKIAYSITDMPDMVESATAEELSAYVIDEAIDAADSRRYMSKLNVDLTNIFTRIRKKRNIYFWCIPDFYDIDPRMRNRIADFRFHVYWRSTHEERSRQYAKAFMFAKDMNFFNPDRWGVKDMPKYAIHSIDKLERLARRNPCFVGRVAFPIMPKSIEDRYKIKSFEALKAVGQEFRLTHKKADPPAPAGQIGE